MAEPAAKPATYVDRQAVYTAPFSLGLLWPFDAPNDSRQPPNS